MDALSCLLDLDLTKHKSLEKEGHEHRHAVFKSLPDMYVKISTPELSLTVANVDVKSHKDFTIDEGTEILLLLSTAKLIDIQRDDIFCSTVVKLINEWKMSSAEQYFINNDKLLHKFVKEGD